MAFPAQKTKFHDSKPLFDRDYPPDKHYKIDLSLSENPLGCSPLVLALLQSEEARDTIQHYPDRSCSFLRKSLSGCLGIQKEAFYIADGASGTLQDIVKLFISPGKHILMPDSTFPAPAFGATALGGYARTVPLRTDFHVDFDAIRESVDDDTGLIFVCNPNNPTGILEAREDIISLANAVPFPVVVSEANIEFPNAGSLLDIKERPGNLMVVRSFSKAYGLAGLRVGYAVCSVGWVEKLRKYNHIFKVGALSERLAGEALKDQEHVRKSVDFVREQRSFLMREVENLGFQTIPSQSNTFVARLPRHVEGEPFLHDLQNRNCAVVSCGSFLSLGPSFIRISPRSSRINEEFLRIVEDILA